MPRLPEPLPEDLGEVFSCAAASASGISPKRLRAADLDTPFRGVRRKRGTEDAVACGPLADDQDVRCRVLDHARAYAQIMDERAFFCGRTAAVLWGTSARPSRELEVGVTAPVRAPRRHGIRGRQLAPTHVEVTSLREGSMSPLETDFRLVVVATGLPEPALDVEVRDHAGRLVGIADAVWPDYRVIAEVEGDHHRTSRRQWARDIEKHTAYVALGFEVIRLTSAHIRPTGSAAVTLVGGALRRRGWSPPR